MKRLRIKDIIFLTGITVFSVFAGIILGMGKQSLAASSPKFAGVEKVIYLDGQNKISVQGKHIVSVRYASSKNAIAVVDSAGTVKPRAKGKTQISASVVYKKKASGKKYTKKLKYTLKVLGKAREYFQIYIPKYVKSTYGYTIEALTDKGKELEKLYIPSYIDGKKVKRFYGSCLRDNSNIVSLHMSDNITTIYGGVVDCHNLKRLYIGKKLSNIGTYNVFIRCGALEEIILDERNEYFTLLDGVLFSADKRTLVLYPRAKLQSSYAIPDGARTLASGAFAGCKYLKEVVIPESVEGFGHRCFSGSGLLSVDIPDQVQYMGRSAFQSCVSLSDVKLSKQFTSIPNNAFKKCTSLKSIFLPAGIQWIDASAFAGCSQLMQFETGETNQNFYVQDGVLFDRQKTLVCYPKGRKESVYRVPDDVMAIGTYAFCQCKMLEKVELPAGLERICGYAFSESALKEITLPDSIKYIEFYAFQGCKALNKVKLPQTLVSLPLGIFSGCESMEEIRIPKEVSSIAVNAFNECSNLKRYLVDQENTTYMESDGVLFSKSMKTLYSYPSGREAKKYTIPATVTSLKEGAFQGAAWLSGLSVPDSVRSIGYHAFMNCGNLETVKLSNNLESIVSEAFVGCSALKKITIPFSVKKIDSWAFKGCTSLETITLPNGTKEIEDGVFSGCKGLKTVKLGKDVKKIGSKVFEDCTGLKKLQIKTKNLTEKFFGKDVFLNAGKDKGKKLVVEVPSDKRIAYQKLFLSNGLSKYATIK